MNQPVAPTRPRLRWYQYSLRSLLIFICLLCVFFAWIAREREQSKRELQIAELLREKGSEVTLGGPYDARKLHWFNGWSDESPSWWRMLARQILGERVFAVHVRNPDFKDLTMLTGLTNLRSLVLRGTKVSDLGPLSDLKSLWQLDLDSTPVQSLVPLSGLKELQMLSLMRTKVHDLCPLKGNSALKSLELNETPVTDLGPLANVTNLKYLDLADTSVFGITPLAELKNLRWVLLDLSSNQVSHEEMEALQKALPMCKVVNDE